MTSETATTTIPRGESAEVVKPAEDDARFWSVTTLIGALDKPALLYWAAEQAALAAIHGESTWRGMSADCGDECSHSSASECASVKWIRDARFRRPKNRLSAASLGTVVHNVVEEYALTGVRPGMERVRELVADELGGKAAVKVIDGEAHVADGMVDRFDGWAQRFTPAYHAAEMTVYHPQYGYAGTLDAIVEVGGVRFVADYKTTRDPYDSQGKPKTPYPEQVGLQLAAYRHAPLAAVWRPRVMERFRRRYYLLSDGEKAEAVQVPETDAGLVIHITPAACEAFPIRCDFTESFQAFLHVIETFRWLQETSKRIMGDPLMAGGKETA